MKNNNKNSGMSAWKLALIITGSIVAAAAVIVAVVAVLKKLKAKKAVEGCDCGCDCCDDEWEFDDDMLADLRFDDDCECVGECECESCDCGCEGDCDVSAAVDEAIEAIEKMSDDEE